MELERKRRFRAHLLLDTPQARHMPCFPLPDFTWWYDDPATAVAMGIAHGILTSHSVAVSSTKVGGRGPRPLDPKRHKNSKKMIGWVDLVYIRRILFRDMVSFSGCEWACWLTFPQRSGYIGSVGPAHPLRDSRLQKAWSYARHRCGMKAFEDGQSHRGDVHESQTGVYAHENCTEASSFMLKISKNDN